MAGMEEVEIHSKVGGICAIGALWLHMLIEQ